MSQRTKAAELLSEYFEKKGDILTPKQYRSEKDTPIRLEQVKRVFGNWSRMEKIVRALDARNKDRPEPTNAREIVAEQNKALADHEALIRAIGEDVEQKTAREEAARRQIEADALNAATPEGARENKVRQGGPESVDAKTIKESIQRLVANEHAMLAKTPEGSALGKELLGGVEDQDQKNLAIARQNARTERNALLASTGEGAALAKMEDDDTDGRLTREAQARLRNELRLYVEPATDEAVSAVVEDATSKVRDEVKPAVEELANKENLSTGAAMRGDDAHDATGADTIVKEGDLSKSPPATRVPDLSVADDRTNDEDKTGISTDSLNDLRKAKPADQRTTTKASGAPLKTSPTAKENKESVNLEQNKENPETPPADRNPDPAVTTAAAKENKPAAKTPAKK